MVHTYVGQHEVGAPFCAPDLHCHSCNRDEDGRAYIVCPECGHLYRTAWELKRAYLAQSLRIFLIDVRRPKGGITLKGFEGGDDDVFIPFTPPRFARLLAPWFLLRSLFRRPSPISFCQLCIHDF